MNKRAHIELTSTEEESVRRVLGKAFLAESQLPSLDDLLNRWANVVQLVKDNYPFGMDDYRNDLYNRSIIQQVVDDEIDGVVSKLMPILFALDNEFKNNTVESPRWLGRAEFPSSHYWWNRIPKTNRGLFSHYE